MIGGAPSSVGVEEGWPHRPKVPQFPRLTDRDPAQLHEEVTQIQGWVPSRTLIKIEHDDFSSSPKKIRRPEVTVHEREMQGESWRLIHDLSEGSSQTWRLGMTPGTEVPSLGLRSAIKVSGEMIAGVYTGIECKAARALP